MRICSDRQRTARPQSIIRPLPPQACRKRPAKGSVGDDSDDEVVEVEAEPRAAAAPSQRARRAPAKSYAVDSEEVSSRSAPPGSWVHFVPRLKPPSTRAAT